MRNLILFLAFAVILPLQDVLAIDLNGNGVCDVWEHRYNAATLVADESGKSSDQDGDGETNFEEGLAGTDPHDPLSVHRIKDISTNGGEVTIQCSTQKGKTYQAQISEDLLPASWSPHGSPALATEDSMANVIQGQTGVKKFYRVITGDTDTDNDGVSNWAEEQLDGFNPDNNDSFGSGNANNDLAALQSLLNALDAGEITITATIPDAYEKESTPAKFTIARSGATTYPFTLFLFLGGHTDSSKGSASPNDYLLKDSSGVAIEDSITIPAGASSVELFCHPVADNVLEVPETLTCTIGATGSSASVRVCDAANTPENARLFVAQLSPEGSAVTTASGLSTILVQGDNEFGDVNLTFYGLTTPQTAVHIHIKNPVSGPHVESLPMGQVSAFPWQIRSAQFIATDQSMLDALFAGNLYVNVHSSNYPSGEIRGDYLLSTGSTDLVIPPPPPAIPPLTGDALDRDIARFLTQATFGPTPELMSELRSLINSEAHNGDRISAYSSWIANQISTPSPDLEPYIHAADAQQNFLSRIPGSPDYDAGDEPRDNNRRRGWWLLSRHAPDQLRQRTAFALSEIFVTSGVDSLIDSRHYGQAHYYDMLKNGAFGSYRDLIEAISTHPIMGQYLSHLRNSKEITDEFGNVIVSPDENYARELMQLFSIGLVQLHEDGSLKINSAGLPDPTYAQDDISAMSRVFTGWSFSKVNSPSTSDTVADNDRFTYGNGSRYYQAQWTNRMKNFADYHDTGEKNMPTLNLDIPAGGDGESDLDAVMDYLSNHENTAPFISRRLIQRLVTSNPSAGYIYRVTQTWKTSNGDLGEVIKAILLDYEARSLEAILPDTYGKKKEPLIHLLACSRAIGATSKLPLDDLDPADTQIADLSAYAFSPTNLSRFSADLAKFPAGTTRVRMGDTNSSLGQTPLAAPTVFNWFLPDYSLSGPLADAGLNVPEFQIATEISVITNINLHYALTHNNKGIGGNTLPNQKAKNADGTPHDTYNPYGYGDDDDHLTADFSGNSPMGAAYLSLMDTNGDGKVSSLDTTFDDPASIEAACVALVNHLDLLLCSGQLSARYASGYIPGIVRADNPRDIIIDTLTRQSSYLDDNDNDADQAKVLEQRLKLAVYLIVSSPYAIIQK